MGAYWNLYECLMVLSLGTFFVNQGGHHPHGGVEKLAIIHRKV
jgi:hypothetical protein